MTTVLAAKPAHRHHRSRSAVRPGIVTASRDITVAYERHIPHAREMAAALALERATQTEAPDYPRTEAEYLASYERLQTLLRAHRATAADFAAVDHAIETETGA